MTDTKSPKGLFTAVNITDDKTQTKVLYLGKEIAILDEEHEQLYFLNKTEGYDAAQLIDLANMMKILHLKLDE